MDYKKLYYKFMNYCKTTDVYDRMLNRNPDDFRKDKEYIYTELHHIVPRHSGGTDDEDNLVKLLPEEHYMAHLIRWRAYDSRDDFLSVRFIVNGIESNKRYSEVCGNELVNIRRRVARYRQRIQEFRKIHGWQSDEGIRKISESRIGTFPAVDSETGESVGSVANDHPNVLSGKWIHHSKGKCSVTRISDNKRMFIESSEFWKNRELYISNRPDQRGSKNGNFKILTDELKEILIDLIGEHIEDNHFHSPSYLKHASDISVDHGLRGISSMFLINKFGEDWRNILIGLHNAKHGTNYIYDPKYRKFKSYKNQPIYYWVNNGEIIKRVRDIEIEEFLIKNTDFTRGRKLRKDDK